MKDHIRYSRRITSTRRWQAVRHAVLERDGWACVQCGQTRRLEVDHVLSVRTRPDLAYAPTNCQVLCGACHTRKTRLEVGHPPVSEDRQAWRQSVIALMREGKKSNEHDGDRDA